MNIFLSLHVQTLYSQFLFLMYIFFHPLTILYAMTMIFLRTHQIQPLPFLFLLKNLQEHEGHLITRSIITIPWFQIIILLLLLLWLMVLELHIHSIPFPHVSYSKFHSSYKHFYLSVYSLFELKYFHQAIKHPCWRDVEATNSVLLKRIKLGS